MTAPKRDEVDAWWGSCSVSSVVPGLLASLAASGLVVGVAWVLPHSRAEQLIVMSVLGVFWLFLLLVGIYRVFGFNYRLTTCRLFVEMGLRRRNVQSFELSRITRVVARANRLEKFFGIGRIFVEVEGSTAPLVLRGVMGPEQVAEKIRNLCGDMDGKKPPVAT